MKQLILLLIVVFLPFHSVFAEESSVTISGNPAGLVQEYSAAPTSDAQTTEPIFEAGGSCSATADCGVHGDLTCDGNSTCSFVDRSCFLDYPPRSGSVTCDGVTTKCPSNSSCESACLDEYYFCIFQPESSPAECREDREACVCFC